MVNGKQDPSPTHRIAPTRRNPQVCGAPHSAIGKTVSRKTVTFSPFRRCPSLPFSHPSRIPHHGNTARRIDTGERPLKDVDNEHQQTVLLQVQMQRDTHWRPIIVGSLRCPSCAASQPRRANRRGRCLRGIAPRGRFRRASAAFVRVNSRDDIQLRIFLLNTEKRDGPRGAQYCLS